MTTRRSFLGGASGLALSNFFAQASAANSASTGADTMYPDIVLHNGRVTTLDRANPNATAVAIKDGLFQRVGQDAEIMALAGPDTRIVDLKGKRVLPGPSTTILT